METCPGFGTGEVTKEFHKEEIVIDEFWRGDDDAGGGEGGG